MSKQATKRKREREKKIFKQFLFFSANNEKKNISIINRTHFFHPTTCSEVNVNEQKKKKKEI